VELTGLGGGAALERVARAPRDLPIVAAAARLEVAGGVCRAARLALAGAGPRPQRWPAAEDLLQGQPLSEGLLAQAAQTAEAANPVGDFRGSAEYRRAVAVPLARRALAAAWRQAAG
jgi:carbon-monoxide dehydrogenase medium subunit